MGSFLHHPPSARSLVGAPDPFCGGARIIPPTKRCAHVYTLYACTVPTQLGLLLYVGLTHKLVHNCIKIQEGLVEVNMAEFYRVHTDTKLLLTSRYLYEGTAVHLRRTYDRSTVGGHMVVTRGQIRGGTRKQSYQHQCRMHAHQGAAMLTRFLCVDWFSNLLRSAERGRGKTSSKLRSSKVGVLSMNALFAVLSIGACRH